MESRIRKNSEMVNFLSLLLVLSLASLTYAKTFNVPSCAEFLSALDQAGSGDVIQYGIGDYKCAFDTKRAGVTFRGAPEFRTRLVWSEGSSGKQIIGVKHDKITLEGLMLDGESRPNSGHGLIRVGSSKGVKILRNWVINSGSSNINIGGSIKNSFIYDIEIIGNFSCHSGVRDTYGESLYVSDYNKTGRTDGIKIIGNEFCNFTDNGIDLKDMTFNALIKHNYFHDQAIRQNQSNWGALVTQGQGIQFVDNVIRNVKAGNSVFNLISNGKTEVSGNVIINSTSEALVRSRGNGSSSPTTVSGNLFCQTSTKKIEGTSSGLIVRDNPGIDKPAQDCEPRAKVIMAEMKKYQSGTVPVPPPTPPPVVDLVPLRIANITYGETDSHVVRIYTEAIDDSDPRMNERRFVDQSVKFFDESGIALSFSREKVAPPRHPPGWNFYLNAPWPVASGVRMVADAGWITGAPAVNQLIPRFATEPEPPLPPQPEPEPPTGPVPDPEPPPVPGPPGIIELRPGQTVMCQSRVSLWKKLSGMTEITCEVN